MKFQHHLRQRFYLPTPCELRLITHAYGQELRIDCRTPADADWVASYLYERLVRAAQRMDVKWIGVSSQDELYHRFLADTAESQL